MTKRFVAVCMQLGNTAGHAFTRKEMNEHMDYVCNMIDWAVDQFTFACTVGCKANSRARTDGIWLAVSEATGAI